MDVDRMSGSTLEAMAKAVEGSAVVLMCVSKKYKESQVRLDDTLVVHTQPSAAPLTHTRPYPFDLKACLTEARTLTDLPATLCVLNPGLPNGGRVRFPAAQEDHPCHYGVQLPRLGVAGRSDGHPPVL